MNTHLKGLWPALLMPVGVDGVLDTPRAIAHAKRLLSAGCDGITLFGTTGEGPAFTVVERKALLESMLGAGITAQQIIVNNSAVALGDAIELGSHAARLGVHKQMFMPPFFYNQPRDAGVVHAVSQVVRGVGDDQLQLILYDFPAMSTYGFTHDAITKLMRQHPGQIVGLKDSGGNLAHSLELTAAFPELSILVGAELDIAPTMCVGGAGSINGLANVAPRLMARVIRDPKHVTPEDEQLILSLLTLLSIRPNMPFVVVYKLMLAEQLHDDEWLHVRAPLSMLDDAETKAVRDGYRALGSLLNVI